MLFQLFSVDKIKNTPHLDSPDAHLNIFDNSYQLFNALTCLKVSDSWTLIQFYLEKRRYLVTLIMDRFWGSDVTEF